MPDRLRTRIHDLASSFATSVLHALRGASLDELLGEAARAPAGRAGRAVRVAAGKAPAAARPGRRRGRLARRSAGDIAQVVEKIVNLLKQSPKGLRAEQIRDRLGLQSKELPRPLKEALDGGRIAKSGQKRATTYFVKSGGAAPAAGRGGRAARARKPAAKAAKRTARKAARRAARKSARKAARGTPRAVRKAARGAGGAKRAGKARAKAPSKKTPASPPPAAAPSPAS